MDLSTSSKAGLALIASPPTTNSTPSTQMPKLPETFPLFNAQKLAEFVQQSRIMQPDTVNQNGTTR